MEIKNTPELAKTHATRTCLNKTQAFLVTCLQAQQLAVNMFIRPRLLRSSLLVHNLPLLPEIIMLPVTVHNQFVSRYPDNKTPRQLLHLKGQGLHEQQIIQKLDAI